MEELKYFFSYSRKDSDFVLRLARDLRAAGANVWLDQLDILGGQHWDDAIEKTLKNCKGVMVVLSPEAVASSNVMDEVSYALDEGKLVVPVLIRPCDIPFRLRRVNYIDFTGDYETGFAQLLRALHIEQPAESPESAAVQEPVARDSTAPPEAEPTEPPVDEEQVSQEVEKLLSPEVSEPALDEVDRPEPMDVEPEKVEELLSPEAPEPVADEADQPKPTDLETEKVEEPLSPEVSEPIPDEVDQQMPTDLDAEKVEEPRSPEVSEPVPDEVDHPKRTGPETEKVEELLSPEVSEPVPGEVDHPKPTDLETEKAGSKSQMAKALGAICIVALIVIILMGVFCRQTPVGPGHVETYSLTGTAGPNGVIDPNGVRTVNYDDDLEFTALPNTGYQVDKWSVDGNDVQAGGTRYTLRNIRADHSAKVTFKLVSEKPPVFEVTSSARPDGVIDPNGVTTVNYDDDLEFTARPDEGYEVDKWFVDGNDVQTGRTSYTLVNIQADHSVKVTFKRLEFEVTSSAGPNGAIDPKGATIVTYGHDLEFAADPNEGYEVDKWSLDGNVVQTGETRYTLRSVRADHSAEVLFKPLEFEVTSSAGLNGAIDLDGSTIVHYGDNPEFTAIPDDGYEVDKWSLDGNDVQTGRTSYTLVNIQADHSVKVTFKRLAVEVTSSAGPNGVIDPNGVTTVNYDDDLEFTALPNTGYQVDTWFVEGEPVPVEGTTYTRRDVKSNHTVHVTFRQLDPPDPERPIGPGGCRLPPGPQGSVSEYVLPYLLLLGVWIIIKRKDASRRNALNKHDKPSLSDTQKEN